MILIFIGVAVLIATALFLADTRRGAYYIHGIQGRYFLPVLPLLAIALTRRGDRGPAMLVPAIVMLIVVAHVATLGTIMSIFYTF